jgi:predicted acetyltransferase
MPRVSWDVRPVASLEEFKVALGVIGHYFGGWPPDLERAELFARALPLERVHAARDGDAIVGGAGAFPLRLTVPGGVVDCAGVTVVGVLPTHRRRGILGAMMREQLDDVCRRGEPLAALWASEEAIYGRFGYGVASFMGEIEVARSHSGLRVPRADGARARLVSLEEAKTLVPPIYDRVRAETPGMFERSADWWEVRNLADPPERRDGAGEKNAMVLSLDGRDAGYALYRLTAKWEAGSSVGFVSVVEALGDSPAAVTEVWRFLLELDWMASVKAALLPVDHPLLHLLEYPRRMRMRISDALWCRLVDVGAALSARSYVDGEPVVFDVADAFLPDNAGRWRLADGRAERTEDEAHLALDVSALGSVYLGGVTFSELLRASAVRELEPGAARRADAIFATPLRPWCPEIF